MRWIISSYHAYNSRETLSMHIFYKPYVIIKWHDSNVFLICLDLRFMTGVMFFLKVGKKCNFARKRKRQQKWRERHERKDHIKIDAEREREREWGGRAYDFILIISPISIYQFHIMS